MRGGGGQKLSVFVHAQGIKTVHAGERVKKWQNSVHIVVECSLKTQNGIKFTEIDQCVILMIGKSQGSRYIC